MVSKGGGKIEKTNVSLRLWHKLAQALGAADNNSHDGLPPICNLHSSVLASDSFRAPASSHYSVLTVGL